jgi:hypothetical protein
MHLSKTFVSSLYGNVPPKNPRDSLFSTSLEAAFCDNFETDNINPMIPLNELPFPIE